MTHEHDQGLTSRIESIERRLSAIESRLAITCPETPPAPIAPPIAPPIQPARGAPAPPAAAPLAPASPPTEPPVTRPPVVTRPRPAPPRKPKRDPISLETLVGGKVFAVVGALVIVTGIALFLKLAYDLGWLSLISPAGKCMLGAAFGALLLIAGEFALRRWSAAASAALFATGVGALYASAYAAYAFYQLVPTAGAFALLAVVSAIGLVAALRARLASVAILSIISAYVTPILMADTDAPAFVLPAYLLAIIVVGLTLSVLHKRFRVLRSLVWWGTAILGTLWVFTDAPHAPITGVVFLTAVWLAFHAELWLAARRGGMGTGAPAIDVSRPLLVSLGSTSWAVLLTAFTLFEQNSSELWLAPGAAMIFTSVLAMIMAGHLRVLTDVPRTDEERLGACLLAQSGALLIAAIAMGVSTDWLQVAAWLVFGVAAIFAGRWVRSHALDVYGLVVLSIGLARLVLLDSWLGAMTAGGVGALGLVLTEWTLMMAIAGACWIAAGVLLVRPANPERHQFFPIACTMVGCVALLASIVHPDAAQASLALAWGAAAVVAMGAHAAYRRLALDAGGVVALALAFIAWSITYLLEGWADTAGAWTIHPGLLVAIALVLVATGGARWLRDRTTLPGAPGVLAVTGVMLLLASTSHEVARQVSLHVEGAAPQADALAAWWVLFALTAIAWGVVKRAAAVQYVAVGLVVLAALAWLGAYPLAGWQGTARAWTLHPGIWSSGFIVVALAAMCAWMSARDAAREGVWTLAITAVVLLFASTSFEMARHVVRLTDDGATQAGAVSIWWGLFAIALLLWGFLAGRSPARWAGLALLAVATAKAVVLDLAGVDPAWRVASFLGLGLLMIGVGTWYLRAVARASALRSHDDDGHAGDQPAISPAQPPDPGP